MIYSKRLFKTLWQKIVLLIISNFSICCNDFHSISKYLLIYRDVTYFCQDIFKVICCRFVVCVNFHSSSFFRGGGIFSIASTHRMEQCVLRNSYNIFSLFVNPFRLVDAFWPLCSRLLKTLWQKKKLLMHDEQFLLLPQRLQIIQ